MQQLTPKNGKYLVAMMVGGFPDRARELRDGLAKHRGIFVQHHVDPQRTSGFLKAPRLPEDVDLVLMIKSQMDDAQKRRLDALLERYEREHGVALPVVMTEHKWTAISQHLQARFGISQSPPLPDELLFSPYFKAPHEHEQRRAEELRVPLAAMARIRESKPEPEPRLDPRVKIQRAPEPPAPPVAEAPPLPPPAPEPVAPVPPPAAGPDPVQVEQGLRREYLQTDTLALIRELQARLPLTGIRSIQISADKVTVEMAPLERASPSLTLVTTKP